MYVIKVVLNSRYGEREVLLGPFDLPADAREMEDRLVAMRRESAVTGIDCYSVIPLIPLVEGETLVKEFAQAVTLLESPLNWHRRNSGKGK